MLRILTILSLFASKLASLVGYTNLKFTLMSVHFTIPDITFLFQTKDIMKVVEAS